MQFWSALFIINFILCVSDISLAFKKNYHRTEKPGKIILN